MLGWLWQHSPVIESFVRYDSAYYLIIILSSYRAKFRLLKVYSTFLCGSIPYTMVEYGKLVHPWPFVHLFIQNEPTQTTNNSTFTNKRDRKGERKGLSA